MWLEYGTAAAMNPYDRTSVNFRHKGLFSDPDPNLSELIHYWVHEAVHATSNTKVAITISPKISYTLESGVSAESLTLNPGPEDKRIVKYLGEDLDEAITEHIANTILAELSRRGIFKRDDDKIRKEAAYKSQGELFTSVVSALAKHLEVDEELIWRSFVRQYFTGEISMDEFHSTLLQLTKDKKIEFVREQLVSLIDETKASKIMRVGKEFEITEDSKSKKEKDALEWSKRGLRLDQ